MKLRQPGIILFILSLCFAYGCANIVPPEGGKKDVKPPKLLAVSPADSQLNARVTKLEMRFDEFVNLANASADVQMSPLLPIPLSVTATGKRVVVKIPDSLLHDNTTYRLSFGNAIRDLHEDNVFQSYVYTFSTGGYFDSLHITGHIIDASTGLPDSGAFVMLYDATESDSAIVRKKPLYVIKSGMDGSFKLAGLPGNKFHLYALKDANNNLVYDGGEEKIAFVDNIVLPGDTASEALALRIFKEEVPKDTTSALQDSLDTVDEERGIRKRRRKEEMVSADFVYNVAVDTNDNDRKRTVDITKPVKINFSKRVDEINTTRVYLAYDSLDIQVEASFNFTKDTAKDQHAFLLNVDWKQDTRYTLKLLKGFAKDSTGADAMPSKYAFRTKSDDDYSKLTVHMDGSYNSPSYLLLINNGNDTVYHKNLTDTMVRLVRLAPATYTIRLIVDSNRNGKWDTGDLFAKRQPEIVIPYPSGPVQLKAGWDNTIDFLPPRPGKKNAIDKQDGTSPGKRDKR
jgi:hypothetical protein